MLTNILTSPIKTTPQIHATDLYRRLIQINDRAALEKFSEFELVTKEKQAMHLTSGQTTKRMSIMFWEFV